jgi:hypothetical protein
MTAAAGESEQFRSAIARIDQANAEDPARVHASGVEEPATLDYARRMTTWLERLYPDASEPLRLAVRAQHLRRWAFARDRYPMTRAGYHQWRTAAGRFSAEQVASILREIGYDEATIARVGELVQKEGLKTGDAETQALEDSTCLAFLERDFADFAAKHEDEKMIGIVRRTWRKMSPRGQAAALTLDLPENAKRLIGLALAQSNQDAPADR